MVTINEGYYIKILLKDKGLKTKYVANEMGISASSLSSKLGGYRKFKKKEIDILLKLLKMKYEEVFQVKMVSIIDEQNFIILNNVKYYISPSAINEIIDIVKNDRVAT